VGGIVSGLVLLVVGPALLGQLAPGDRPPTPTPPAAMSAALPPTATRVTATPTPTATPAAPSGKKGRGKQDDD
jgi:hypothetical protein